MKQKLIAISLLSILFIGITLPAKKKKQPLFRSYATQELADLIPANPAEIEKRVVEALDDAKKRVERIIAIPAQERTYANTVKPFDEIGTISDFAIMGSVTQVLGMVSPDRAIRETAHKAFARLEAFGVDHISNNVLLCIAIKEYAQGNASKEFLTQEEHYYLDKVINDFKRGGLDLSSNHIQEIKELKKQLAQLELTFGNNIAQDNRHILVTREGLHGLDAEFINNVKKNDAGLYILDVDSPTYLAVMENCAVEQTRKDLYIAFNNRAYPINKRVLLDIVAKRDQLAKKLGFSSYADLDLDNQMVQTQNRAQSFIAELLVKSQLKEQQEFDQLIQDLPAGVVLNNEKKLNPWDVMYAKNQYKKKHFALDEQEIAQYFPMEQTLQGLFTIYQNFFSLIFKRVQAPTTWHEDVVMIETYDQSSKELLGYILLDLYPRENKYTHACSTRLIPSTYSNGKAIPVVALVIANFPKPHAQKPSLLKRGDVSTFFHEFGHALHGILGRTHIASFSGICVKFDFVEMPSQMLEEWLNDKDILSLVSCHYQTGKQLPNDLIERISALKNINIGEFVAGRSLGALVSLNLFAEGENKDIDTVCKQAHEACRKYISYAPDNHSYASFGHLTNYGAKYYGYMWSKVFALDLFSEIKKHGLLNPVIGKKYVAEVLAKGGSQDPNILLRNFLGRDPSQDALLKELGL